MSEEDFIFGKGEDILNSALRDLVSLLTVKYGARHRVNGTKVIAYVIDEKRADTVSKATGYAKVAAGDLIVEFAHDYYAFFKKGYFDDLYEVGK